MERAGWYGKIPALGDFASRRLPRGFVDEWDGWLQRSIAASREQLQQDWLGLYLNAPLWRFALFPGVCGPDAWIGVMMPSVDSVGRYFPLTIALEIEAGPQLAAALGAPAWFEAIEQAALSCLDLHCTPEALERLLAAAPPGPGAGGGAQRAAAYALDGWWSQPDQAHLATMLPAGAGVDAVLEDAGRIALARRAAHTSMWWTTLPGGGARLELFAGLPPGRCFARLLSGAPVPAPATAGAP
jgi:type VI secretion system protein ImpM